MRINKKRVLVVDDDAQITQMMQLFFERTNEYEVRTETAPLRALAAAQEFKSDIILLDVNMPEMGGGELASRLAEIPSLKGVPVIFLTGSVSKAELAAGDGTIGGLTFMAKPASRDEVLGCLRKTLRAQTPARRRSPDLCDVVCN